MPQTPLAHLNLLARNRGLPNAYWGGVVDDLAVEQYANYGVFCSHAGRVSPHMAARCTPKPANDALVDLNGEFGAGRRAARAGRE